MKVIIAGGREFNDYQLLKLKCDQILSATDKATIEIVEGGARGADALGKQYAKQKGYARRTFEANWELDGKAAGVIRNRKMAEYADALIAFWNGSSRGTMNMINVANELGLKVRVIKYR